METEEPRSMEAAPAEFSPPEDVLSDILGRLPHRDLAQSRRVCTQWRTVVDARRLLLRHALPHTVRGLFLHYRDDFGHYFFARPAGPPASSSPEVDGKLALLPEGRRDYTVLDHRNGLILAYSDSSESLYVANPATRRWARLPSLEWTWRFQFDPYLVFEPAVSPHYEVWLVPSERPLGAWDDDLQDEPAGEDDMRRRKLMEEWPPSPCVLKVLSSRTGRWEEKAFVREGAAAGTVADLKKERDSSLYQLRQSAYWKGALYVHCRGCYIMRLSLADNKYQTIKTPANIDDCCAPQYCLGNSRNGVHFAAIFEGREDLRVWILEEPSSSAQAKWVLKHDTELESTALNTLSSRYSDERGGCWSYEFEGNWNLVDGKADEDTGLTGENVEWDSDDDDVLSMVDGGEICSVGYFLILGFHPYKEVVFLAQYSRRAVAYHFNTSKVQYLGSTSTRRSNSIEKSFVYTPCMIGQLPESSSNNAVTLTD